MRQIDCAIQLKLMVIVPSIDCAIQLKSIVPSIQFKSIRLCHQIDCAIQLKSIVTSIRLKLQKVKNPEKRLFSRKYDVTKNTFSTFPESISWSFKN